MQPYFSGILILSLLRRIRRQIIAGILISILVAPFSVLIPRTVRAEMSSRSSLPSENKERLESAKTTDPSKSDAVSKEQMQKAYSTLPVNFEANYGQMDDQVKFISRARNYKFFLTDRGATFVLNKRTRGLNMATQRHLPRVHDSWPIKISSRPGDRSTILKMTLVGANSNPKMVGLERAAEITNYFIGRDPKNWRTDVPNYARVKVENIYPQIDMLYHFDQSGLEYDFILAPKCDPNRVVVDFEGVQKLGIESSGDLLLQTDAGEVRQHRPYIYQEVAGIKQTVSGHYILKGKTRVGFEVGAYDGNSALIIDPQLTYSTYLGGTGNDFGGSIAVDADGNAYVAGKTDSINFPVSGAFQPTLGGGFDIFVTKLNKTGNALVYSTYLGGSSNEGFGASDRPPQIVLDSSRNAYVSGTTSSNNFPVTAGAYQTTAVTTPEYSPNNLFITKLNTTGNALVYSTYLGGSNLDNAAGIAVDSSGNAYVTGLTYSTSNDQVPTPFPVTAGAFQTTLDTPGVTAFVTKLNSTGTALVYSTYLGGRHRNLDSWFYNSGNAIAVDGMGNAYVAGYTECDDFPVTPGAFQPTTHESPNDVPQESFVTKLNATGTALIYSTYLGGSGGEYYTSNGIAVDSSGNAYVNGVTGSTDFPVTPGALKTTLSGTTDLYLTKLNATGSALIYSTYIGGSGDEYSPEYAPGLALDSCGYVYVTGTTNSSDFLVTTDAYQATFRGIEDFFVIKLNREGTQALYSSYLGGSDDEWAPSIALDSVGDAYVTGRTKSTNFPVTTGAFRTTLSGSWDAFITKFPLADIVERSSVVAPDATAGTPPYTSASAEYHPGADGNNYHQNATIDATVLPDRPTELWAKYYWPQGLSAGPYPLVVFLHGNHLTCGRTWTPFLTSVTPGTVKNNSSSWLGMKITTSSQPITVRYLGRRFLSGNTGTHTVKIVRASDNATIASVSVPMAGGTVNQFIYVQLASPITLAANTSYYIASQEVNHGDSWYDSNTIVTSTTVATVNGRVSSNNGSSWSTNGAVPGLVYGPVDFAYDVPARIDDNLQYTTAGTCPSGYSIAPSHRGYDYLANQLASWGYIVVSINANLGINMGAAYASADNPDYPEFPDDPNLNFARGRLVLRHLQQLSEWNVNGGTPASLGVEFRGKIDFSNIGLMGHSRGGEGMRAAYNLYRDVGSPWPARILNPAIFKGIFEIAPVDGQTNRILDADGLAWNVLLPACDGDVWRLKGVRPFDRIMGYTGNNPPPPADSPATQKSTFMVWGANHNFYNTQWQRSEWTNDSTACIGSGNVPLFLNPTVTGTGYGSLQEQQTALGSLIPFIRANVGATSTPTFNQNFDPRYNLPSLVTSVTRVNRGVTPSPNSSVTTVFEDFSNVTGKNTSGVDNDAGNISISHVTATECSGCLTVPDHFYYKQDPNSNDYDFMPLPPASQLFKAGFISWTSSSLNTYFQTNWRSNNDGVNISAYQTLDFDISRQRSDTQPTQPHALNTSDSTNLSIQLVMANEERSLAVCLSSYANLTGPVGSAFELHPIMQTVRIPLTDFANVDLSLVRGIRFTFNKTATGAIYIANIRLARQ